MAPVPIPFTEVPLGLFAETSEICDLWYVLNTCAVCIALVTNVHCVYSFLFQTHYVPLGKHSQHRKSSHLVCHFVSLLGG